MILRASLLVAIVSNPDTVNAYDHQMESMYYAIRFIADTKTTSKRVTIVNENRRLFHMIIDADLTIHLLVKRLFTTALTETSR